MAKSASGWDLNGKWVFFTPVPNLLLTKAVNSELQMGRVIFLAASKLRRVRNRYGIKERISDLPVYLQDFFRSAPTFALVRYSSGRPQELEPLCLQMVHDALCLLQSSLLGYSGRDSMRRLVTPGGGESVTGSYFFVNPDTDDPLVTVGRELNYARRSLKLDADWKRHQKHFFFLKLRAILDNKVKVQSAWRENLRRAAMLVGESRVARDTASAFLFDMIALEMLLTKQGDKYRDALPKRIEAFLGWADEWHQKNFSERIDKIYTLRCNLVHDGDSHEITPDHLQFTDNLLLSLLTNLVNFPALFSSKQAVLDFSEKVAAEHLLGIKPKVRPKRLIIALSR